jgi:hypothetical protein
VKSPAHRLDDRHLGKGRLHRLSRGTHGLDGRAPGGFGGCSGFLGGRARGFPGHSQELTLVPDQLDRLAMLITDLPSLLGESPKLLCLVPAEFG